MVKTYDPKDVAITCGAKILSGYADGTFVTVERNSQTFNQKVGADGESTRVKSNDKSGKITVVLMQSSASNDDLSAFAAADELNNQGVFPVTVKDNSGRSLYAAATAWIQKQPNAEFGKEANMRTWVLETDNLDMFTGGN